MPTSPEELFTFAKEMCVGSEPTKVRAGVSRAYYAAFHALNAVVWDMAPNDGMIGECGTLKHGEIARRLREWPTLHPNRKLRMGFGVEARQLYDKLIYCRNLRHQADYVIESKVIGFIESRNVLARVRRLLDFCRKASAFG